MMIMKIIERIKKWWGDRQCRKGKHLWLYRFQLIGKAKLGDAYKRCVRCGREALLTTNLSVVCFNADSNHYTEICEVLGKTNEILKDAAWEAA